MEGRVLPDLYRGDQVARDRNTAPLSAALASPAPLRTERTDLDENDGPLKTGACAEVDMVDGEVEEIEREIMR